MGIAYNTSIVRDGLALHLDAANVKSYPGSGSVVTDLSKNGRNCNFTGTFDSANGGSFAMNGAGQKLETTNVHSISSTVISATTWVKVDAFGNFHNFIRNNWVNSGWIIYASSTVWTAGVAQTGNQYAASISHNNSTDWTFLGMVYDGFDIKLFVNDTSTTGAAPDGLTLDTGYKIIFGDGTRPSAFNIANSFVYNRVLSDAEILQNFEAMRGRYGI